MVFVRQPFRKSSSIDQRATSKSNAKGTKILLMPYWHTPSNVWATAPTSRLSPTWPNIRAWDRSMIKGLKNSFFENWHGWQLGYPASSRVSLCRFTFSLPVRQTADAGVSLWFGWYVCVQRQLPTLPDGHMIILALYANPGESHLPRPLFPVLPKLPLLVPYHGLWSPPTWVCCHQAQRQSVEHSPTIPAARASGMWQEDSCTLQGPVPRRRNRGSLQKKERKSISASDNKDTN